MHFRWPKIRALFFHPFSTIFGCLLFLFPLTLVIVDSSLRYLNVQYIRYEYYRNLLYILFICLIVIVHTFFVLTSWYENRFTFFEAEHFFILLVAAIYSSAFFGAINYGLYRLDRTSFHIDEALRSKEFSRDLLSVQKRVDELHKVAQASEKLAAEIARLPLESFSRSRHRWVFGPTYKLDINIEGASIFIDTQTYSGGGPMGGGVQVTIWTVKAEAWGEEILISPEIQFDSGYIIEPLKEEVVKKQDLVHAFKYRADWERKNRLIPLEEHLAKRREGGAQAMTLSWTLFLYQSAMDALGSSPEYFKPATFLTRLIAFITAFLKSAYFGIFVAIIVMKGWAYSHENSLSSRNRVRERRPERNLLKLHKGRRRLRG